jgi:hypothetical protein
MLGQLGILSFELLLLSSEVLSSGRDTMLITENADMFTASSIVRSVDVLRKSAHNFR